MVKYAEVSLKILFEILIDQVFFKIFHAKLSLTAKKMVFRSSESF